MSIKTYIPYLIFFQYEMIMFPTFLQLNTELQMAQNEYDNYQTQKIRAMHCKFLNI